MENVQPAPNKNILRGVLLLFLGFLGIPSSFFFFLMGALHSEFKIAFSSLVFLAFIILSILLIMDKKRSLKWALLPLIPLAVIITFWIDDDRKIMSNNIQDCKDSIGTEDFDSYCQKLQEEGKLR